MKNKIPQSLRDKLSEAGKKGWKAKVKKALASEVDMKKEKKVASSSKSEENKKQN